MDALVVDVHTHLYPVESRQIRGKTIPYIYELSTGDFERMNGVGEENNPWMDNKFNALFLGALQVTTPITNIIVDEIKHLKTLPTSRGVIMVANGLADPTSAQWTPRAGIRKH
ncbi:2-amino-3-carboxymuconate-6-semialdehyde decarboxylase [Penicillium lagena]|uniref:2-amino-3-carboxymuconate-6-semialdehyde decarboxylase n=1 Tax=Penicillium lagena TaxID=94218 RepID=UPI0025413B18|nr:2-amino-3-carboxymuconate-6-semialdehyde decarboxylase [Penicillium lagena]KAJ5620139.1 2-amino-3-carboxymuconate-6-semialdehyde decarboxylase [Penicillium lagena]